jgi:molybdopterin converting factor small subunit
MQVEVLFFGSLTDATEVSAITLADIGDTHQLQQELVKRYPALAKAKYILAVNKKMISNITPLSDRDIVACMPPFSGG